MKWSVPTCVCLPFLLGLLAACEPAEHATVSGTSTITVEGAWVRPTPPGVTLSAAYLSLHNRGSRDDRLLEAGSADARAVEIHEIVRQGDMRRMEHLPGGLALPAGTSVRLAPRGRHLMLIGLRRPLVPGEHFELRLRFERAGPMTVRARVANVSGPHGAGAGVPHGAPHGTPPPGMPHGAPHGALPPGTPPSGLAH